MKIAYITTYDATDRANWSGLGYAILRCLEGAGFEVTPVGPLGTRPSFAQRAYAKAVRMSTGRTSDLDRTETVTKAMAAEVTARMTGQDFDLVFSPGSIPVSRLECSQPIVIWGDATFASLINHYPGFETLSAATLRAGHRTEQSAYDRAALTIFASDWAADSAQRDYAVPRSKIEVLPFGANFNQAPARAEALDSIAQRPSDRIELVSVGVDWTRKGMDRAVAVASALNARGRSARLTIVGCHPPSGVTLPDFVNLAGFIDKRTTEGEAKMKALFQGAHFHLLFSQAECFGVVFSEANAYATPNIASDVGGVGSAVRDGRGGWLMDAQAPIEAIADRIIAQVDDLTGYAALAAAARDEYDARLNWGAASQALRRLLPPLAESA